MIQSRLIKNKKLPSGDTIGQISNPLELIFFPRFISSVHDPSAFLNIINKSSWFSGTVFEKIRYDSSGAIKGNKYADTPLARDCG
jgi:hypothetical protein